jgi:hypothetical protein
LLLGENFWNIVIRKFIEKVLIDCHVQSYLTKFKVLSNDKMFLRTQLTLEIFLSFVLFKVAEFSKLRKWLKIFYERVFLIENTSRDVKTEIIYLHLQQTDSNWIQVFVSKVLWIYFLLKIKINDWNFASVKCKHNFSVQRKVMAEDLNLRQLHFSKIAQRLLVIIAVFGNLFKWLK